MTSFLQCIDAFVDELRWEENDSAKLLRFSFIVPL